MEREVRLGLFSVANPFEVGAERGREFLRRIRDSLIDLRFQRLRLITLEKAVTDFKSAAEAGWRFYEEKVDALCAVAACWFEDHLVLDVLERCDAPVMTWTAPGMETGSLCGGQQLGFILKELGRPYDLIFDEPDSEPSLRKLLSFALPAALKRRLRLARIGLIGHRVDGMTETTVDELSLKRELGPRVVGIDTNAFLRKVERMGDEKVKPIFERITSMVGRVESAEEEVLESLRFYVALKDEIEEMGLDAVAVGCYPNLMGRFCLGASISADEDAPVSCEGDVNGAVGMLILMFLTGEPVQNTDLLDPIPQENAILFSHCGSSSLTLSRSKEEIVLAPVRLAGEGVCCLFPPKEGDVTLINLIPSRDGYRIGVLKGRALPSEMLFPGNPLKVRFERGYEEVLSWIAEKGLGHHWMAVYGDLSQQIAYLAEFTGVKLEVMG